MYDPAVLQHLLSLLTDATRELICSEDKRGWQPLHWACFFHNAAAVTLLLAAGAELK